jgi:hypothetical protein
MFLHCSNYRRQSPILLKSTTSAILCRQTGNQKQKISADSFSQAAILDVDEALPIMPGMYLAYRIHLIGVLPALHAPTA